MWYNADATRHIASYLSVVKPAFGVCIIFRPRNNFSWSTKFMLRKFTALSVGGAGLNGLTV